MAEMSPNESSSEQGEKSSKTDHREDLDVTTQDANYDTGMQEKQGKSIAVDQELEVRLANPLKILSQEEVIERARKFAHDAGLIDLSDLFAKAALAARDPLLYETLPLLSQSDREILRQEELHRWDHPKQLYLLVICCSLGAVVQGMDQSVINGANLFFPETFGIANESEWFLGIINSAPYFSCALLASFITEPLNNYFGRRGTIFITCFIAFITCIWAGLTHTWWHLIISRVFLGFGIAPKSATVPIFAAECVPTAIRGGLVMQWQLWTAFGIMLGYCADLAFYNVPDQNGISGLNWRLMLGSAAIPPIAVMILVYMSPESPRWYLSKNRYSDAFNAMKRIRKSDLVAARDVYAAYEGVLAERELNSSKSRNRLVEIFSVPRVRKGMQSAAFVMFMQQFCGINVNAYYSSSIFQEAGATQLEALGASLGWGSLNWIMGFPAVWTIDKLGRRGLLLIGFPLMSVFLFWTGGSFHIVNERTKLIMVALGTYLHCAAYSPTEGPVPFTYSSESFPLAHRTIGMTISVAICWFFNGVLSLTFPALMEAFTPTGAFCWYAAWDIFGFFYTYFLLPETKGLSLEELDAVFSVSNAKHASYFYKRMPHDLSQAFKIKDRKSYGKYLYDHEKLSAEERASRGGTYAAAAAGH